MTDGNRFNYMRARYYSAEIRRFVNQDILLGSIADGQSLNRFAFVTGNPVSFVDPKGLSAQYVPCLSLIFADGPAPIGDVAAIVCAIAISLTTKSALETAQIINQQNTSSNDNDDYKHYEKGGLAGGRAPYSHAEEDEARYFIPDPFGGNDACERLKYAIRVLRAQIAWREKDLNPASPSYKGHVTRISILTTALLKLERDYQNICGGNCPG